MRLLFFIWAFLILNGCASYPQSRDGLVINRQPIFHINEQATIEDLKQKDRAYIEQVLSEHDDKYKALQKLVNDGFIFYEANNLYLAMQRFNQAWIINKEHPEIYHGFGAIAQAQGENCAAMVLLAKAATKDWSGLESNYPGFMVDFAYLNSLCGYSKEGNRYGRAEEMLSMSERIFNEQERSNPNAYLYHKWSQALYLKGDFTGALNKVKKLRVLGQEPDADFLRDLENKLSNLKR